MHRKNVKITLDKDALPLTGNLILREIDSVEGLVLDIYFRLRRIDILRNALVRLERAPAKSDDLPSHGMYREYDPIVETVDQRTVVAAYAEPCLNKIVFLISGLTGGATQIIARLRSPSKTIFFNRRIVKLTFSVEILIGNRLSHRGFKRFLKKLRSKFRDDVKAVLMLLAGKVLRRLFLFNDFYVIFLREVAYGLRERQALVLHHEIHCRTGLSASEAFVDSL